MSVACLSPNGGTVTSGDGAATHLLVATIQGLLIYERALSDGSWKLVQHALPEFQISAVLHLPERGRILAGTHGGKGLWASDDFGASWVQQKAGLDRPHIYTVVAQRRADRTVLFCGTEPVALYRSDDFGDHWAEVSTLRDVPDQELWAFPPPPHLAHVKHIAFHPDESATWYVCIEQGALLKTVDDGASWFEQSSYESAAAKAEKFRRDNHRVVIRRSNPKHLLMSGGEGLFRSLDAGDTWQHLLTRDARIGYPDAMFLDPRDDNTVILGGPRHPPREWAAKKVSDATVLVSTDFGTTWQERHAGLPDPVVGNIEAMGLYHHGQSVMLSAGTATGEIFVSDDLGIRWQCIAEHMPPISKAGHYRWFMTDEMRLAIEDQMRAWKEPSPT